MEKESSKMQGSQQPGVPVEAGGSLGRKGGASYVSTGKNEERPNGDAGRVACLLPNGFYFLKELGGKVFWNFGRN